ncbi:ABC transporter substrate-binding protein [Paenibacillus ginsengarvi]|uniref:Extracellular solute-binding protein n=1 Tax=Paenibacillus ginsengarvi TaxID=400777 RepID=A0A3B0BKK6_9BACL|nr:extracellular solute-binding protein [Paenibacillus ginsengarvi]RKN73020.1 extracellular solute-binding protein [Paenibacillus ginsengarvi]
MKKWIGAAAVSVLASALLAGCGGAGGAGAGKTASGDTNKTEVKEAKKADPVTITIGVRATGYLTEDEIQRYIVQPVSKKYPHITINRIVLDDKTNSFENLLAAGSLPDIIFHTSLLLPDLKRLKVDQDLTAGLKTANVDLTKFNATALDAIKITSENDFLMGIPYTMHFNALYYNKDIFDKFGAAYPKDGMTWQDVTELAKKVTRKEDTVQYRGFEPDSIYRAGSQLGLPLIEPKTFKSLGNTDDWKKVVQMAKDVYDIPGNGTIQTFSSGVNAFVKDRKLAMLAGLNWLPNLAEVKDQFTNWDLASYPTWPGKPGIGTQIDLHVMVVPSTSKHKEAALQVIETVVSDEVQSDMAKNGRVSVLKDKKYQDTFAQNLDFVKGKNIPAIFKSAPTKPFPSTIHANKAFNEITKVMTQVTKNNIDVNTALRSYDELMDKYIAEQGK